MVDGCSASLPFRDDELAFRTLRNMVLVFSVALTGSGSSSAIYKSLGAKLSSAHHGAKPSKAQLVEVIDDMNAEIRDRWADYAYELSSLRYDRRSDRKILRDVFELRSSLIMSSMLSRINLNDLLFAKKSIWTTCSAVI